MATSKVDMIRIRNLVVNAYRFPELTNKIKNDFPPLFEKWQYYRSIGSNFCPRVMATFEVIYREIVDSNKISEYKQYVREKK